MVADYEGSIFAAAADDHAAVNGRQRGIAAAASSVAGFDQCGPQPAITFAGLGAAAFAGAFIATRGYTRPARHVPVAGEAAHVGADLSDDHGSVIVLDPGNGGQQCQILRRKVPRRLSNAPVRRGK